MRSNYSLGVRKKPNFLSGFSLTNILIAVNVFIFLFALILVSSLGEEFFVKYLALTPSMVVSGVAVWTVLTSIFMHGSFFHLFANMFSLFFIGNFLEKIIGRKRFFWSYLVAGIIGGGFFIMASFVFGGMDVPAVGASGAIFGILGVLAVLVPYSRIYLIVGPLVVILVEVLLAQFLPVSIMNPLTMVLNLILILMIFAIFSFRSSFRKFAIPVEMPLWVLPIVAIVPLSIIGLFVPLPIGNSAHFGGLIVGLIYGFYLRKKFPRKTARLRRVFR